MRKLFGHGGLYVVETEDDAHLGTVETSDGTLTVRSGQVGRPVVLAANDVVRITPFIDETDEACSQPTMQEQAEREHDPRMAARLNGPVVGDPTGHFSTHVPARDVHKVRTSRETEVERGRHSRRAALLWAWLGDSTAELCCC
jgi:hypothetical protein